MGREEPPRAPGDSRLLFGEPLEVEGLCWGEPSEESGLIQMPLSLSEGASSSSVHWGITVMQVVESGLLSPSEITTSLHSSKWKKGPLGKGGEVARK